MRICICWARGGQRFVQIARVQTKENGESQTSYRAYICCHIEPAMRIFLPCFLLFGTHIFMHAPLLFWHGTDFMTLLFGTGLLSIFLKVFFKQSLFFRWIKNYWTSKYSSEIDNCFPFHLIWFCYWYSDFWWTCNSTGLILSFPGSKINLVELLAWFSLGWVKIDGPTTAHVKAKILTLANAASQCLGTALVRNDCWSFLKGGFTLNSASETSVLYFQVIYLI
jgi:hypothetical protein